MWRPPLIEPTFWPHLYLPSALSAVIISPRNAGAPAHKEKKTNFPSLPTKKRQQSDLSRNHTITLNVKLKPHITIVMLICCYFERESDEMKKKLHTRQRLEDIIIMSPKRDFARKNYSDGKGRRKCIAMPSTHSQISNFVLS